MSEQPAGMTEKFHVERVTPSSRGIDHTDCRYFVIDPQHDPHATAALLAYAASCDSDEPQLAADLRMWAAPEPRSTPGPSTGTPEPSQAAGEWIATSHTPPSLDQPVRREAWFDGYRAARDDAGRDVPSDEVARLREALERVRALADVWTTWDYLMGSDFPPLPHDGPGYAKALQSILASVDATAPDEADEQPERRCSQCGRGVSDRACGPTHALLYAEQKMRAFAAAPAPDDDEADR